MRKGVLTSRSVASAISRCFVRRSMVSRSDDRVVTQIKTHTIDKSPIVKSLWQDRLDLEIQQGAPNEELHSPDYLIDKACSDSRVTVQYGFQSDAQLRESYQDAHGCILVGRLLEDLDALAGNIAFLHCDDSNPNTRALHVVTASVDTIKMSSNHSSLPVCNDYTLSGQVVWSGRSSMDVLIEVHTAEKDQDSGDIIEPNLIDSSTTRVLSCMFTFVARDIITGRSAAINRVTPSNPIEERLYEQRAKEALRRKEKNTSISLCDTRIMSLIERGNAAKDMPALAHPSTVLMSQTCHENTLIMNPQNVNTAGRVFGGYLMHRAYDLALATCYTFAGAYPKFKEVGEVTFKKPVDIGDLVRLRSRVVYASDNEDGTFKPTAHVEVECQVVRPEKASSFVSNTFDFSFTFERGTNISLRRVLPCRREEAERLIMASGRDH